MLGNRIHVGERVNSKLRTLQQRTRLTPNLLCRIGFCLSIEDQQGIDPALYSDGNDREFNMSTLVGDYRELFVALLRERLHGDGLDFDEHAEEHFRAHISRGVLQLDLSVKRLEDLTALWVEG